MKKLTTISEITGLPMLAWLKESCGEDSCGSECEDHGSGMDCKNCKVQEAITRLHHYEKTGFEPEEIKDICDTFILIADLPTHRTLALKNCLQQNKRCDEYKGLLAYRATGMTPEQVDRLTAELEAEKKRTEILTMVADDLFERLQDRGWQGATAERELKAYKQAEKDGLLVKLPCPVGSMVFRLYNTRGCRNCEMLHTNCDARDCPEPKIRDVKFKPSYLEIMEDIRLTREEAEQALEVKKHMEIRTMESPDDYI